MDKLTKAQVAVRERWTAALRSGKYRQGKNRLKSRSGAMCCLGVLCDVVDPAGWRGLLHQGMVSLPDEEISRSAAAQWESYIRFTRLNDVDDFSFDEIADVIDLDTMMRQDGAL